MRLFVVFTALLLASIELGPWWLSIAFLVATAAVLGAVEERDA
jgi:hypothetical protein